MSRTAVWCGRFEIDVARLRGEEDILLIANIKNDLKATSKLLLRENAEVHTWRGLLLHI